MCLALSICVLFNLLIQSVNGTQFLSINFLLALFGLSPARTAIDIAPLTITYASLESHKTDLKIKVLSLIGLLVLYVPRESSFISTQLFVLNLVGWFGVLSKKFIIFRYSSFILLKLILDYQ